MGNTFIVHAKTINWEAVVTNFKQLQNSPNNACIKKGFPDNRGGIAQSTIPSATANSLPPINSTQPRRDANLSNDGDHEGETSSAPETFPINGTTAHSVEVQVCRTVTLERVNIKQNRSKLIHYAPVCSNQLTSEPTFGKELTGTVIEPPVCYKGGLFFVVEDFLNNVVVVGAFNTGLKTQDEARQTFPAGMEITIKNPHLAHGILTNSFECVLVEDPGTNILVHGDEHSPDYSVAPTDVKAWYQLGNEIFKSSGGTAIGLSNSAECFGRGLIMSSRDIVVLLCNRAAAYLNCGLPAYAARDCAAACHLDPENFRSTAPHRLKVALKALNMQMIVDQLDQFHSEHLVHIHEKTIAEAYLSQHKRGMYDVMLESMWWEDSDDLMEALHNISGRITVPTLDQKQQLDHDPQHIGHLAASSSTPQECATGLEALRLQHRAQRQQRHGGRTGTGGGAGAAQLLRLPYAQQQLSALRSDCCKEGSLGCFKYNRVGSGGGFCCVDDVRSKGIGDMGMGRSRSLSPPRREHYSLTDKGGTGTTPSRHQSQPHHRDGVRGRSPLAKDMGITLHSETGCGIRRQTSRSESPTPVISRRNFSPPPRLLPELHAPPPLHHHHHRDYHRSGSTMESAGNRGTIIAGKEHSQQRDQIPRWVMLHKKGVEQFDKQHFDGAAEWFTASMSALVEDDVNNTAAGLLCHRSIKYFQAGKIAQSLVDATVACIINPRFPVAWYRRAIALDRLQHTDAALKAVDTGKSITKAQQGADLNSDFVSLQKQIKKHQAQMEQQAALEQEQAQREKEARERERQRAAEVATQRAAAVHDRLSRGMNIVRTVVGIDLAAEEKRDYWIDYS